VSTVLAALAVSACSDRPDDPPSRTAPSATTACPASLAHASGAACGDLEHVCRELFPCGSSQQIEVCTCTGGVFACVDEVGDIAAGAPPRCMSEAPPDATKCPPSMIDAFGSTCATVGRLCFYDGPRCADGVERMGYCQCTGTPDGGLTFDCVAGDCPPEA
jgi:hypothetical protein